MSLLWWVCGVVWAQVALPVKSVSFTVDVEGPLAEVIVEQVFVNSSDEAIEAVYAFPLHEQAAVDGMIIQVQDRLIEAEVKERRAAQEEYDEALVQGHVAAMTTQSRPNVFTQRVGNLPPGEEIKVWLRVIQPVPRIDGAYELVLPLVVAPRFVRSSEEEVAEPGPLVAVAGRALLADVDVRVRSAVPLASITSPSHPVEIALKQDVHLFTTQVPLDRDFVLRWSSDPERPQAGVLVQDNHLVLTLEAPRRPPPAHIVPREMIWVIDQSCSMGGLSIDLARKAMLRALDYVDVSDSVRILRFSNRVRGDAQSWVATPARVDAAKKEIARIGTSGGTYLLEGVLAALNTREDPDRERYVMFLTDGLIGNERDVLAAIRDNVGDARLFAFGTGSAPNRWLLDEMARFGGGRTTWYREGEDPIAGVDRFIETIAQPVLTDLDIDWGDWEVDDVYPRRAPSLYAGQPLYLTARVYKPGTTPIVVRGRLGDGSFEQVLMPIVEEEGRTIPSTWARQAIANLERDQGWGEDEEVADQIREISLNYQVMSRYTAFIVVDRTRVVNPGGPGPRFTCQQLPPTAWTCSRASLGAP